jgi:hypothetical protein
MNLKRVCYVESRKKSESVVDVDEKREREVEGGFMFTSSISLLARSCC